MVCSVSGRSRFTSIEPLEARFVPATFLVTSAADSGPGTLRQAILNANADSIGDVIRIDGVTEIDLFSPLPAITESIVLQGNGATLDGGEIVGAGDGLVLQGNGSDSAIVDLRVTHFPGHGFVLGDYSSSYIAGCVALENGRGSGGGAGFWVRGNNAELQKVQAIRNGGPGILFDSPLVGSVTQQCLVERAYTEGNLGPEIRGVDLERSAIVNSTFLHGADAAIAIESNSSYGVNLVGNTYVGTSAVPVDLGNNGRSPQDAPSSPSGYLGPDGWPDSPVLTDFKIVGGLTYVTGYVRTGYNAAVEITLFQEQKVVEGTARTEFDRFAARADETGLASFVRILPEGQFFLGDTVRATRLDLDYSRAQISELSDPISAIPAVATPLAIDDPRKVTFTDTDGDLVTVSTTKGRFDVIDFDLVPRDQGYYLAGLRLGADFEGAKVRVEVSKSISGDGRTFVGSVNSEDVNLKSLSIDGNLQRLEVGRLDSSVSVKKLTVSTLGYVGGTLNPYTQPTTITSFGTLKELVCTQSVENAGIFSISGAIGRFDSAFGIHGSVIIGQAIGSVEAFSDISSTIIRAETGAVGRVETQGVIGGASPELGSQILARTSIGSIVAGGVMNSQLVANADTQFSKSGTVKAIGSIVVKRDVVESQILAGVPLVPLSEDGFRSEGNGNVQIGSVRVRGDWVNSDLGAGVYWGADAQFGTFDDGFYRSASESRTGIAQLVIGGEWVSTGDKIHAVTAWTLGKVQVGSVKLPLPDGGFRQTVATANDGAGEIRLVQKA